MPIELRHLVATNASGDVARTHPTRRRVLRSLFIALEESPLCSLATVGPTGRAHISTAYFAYSKDLSIYFLSHPRAQHCENLGGNSSAALTVFRSDQIWGGHDRGVQLFGKARPVRGDAREAAEATYSARFPLYRRWLSARTPAGRKVVAQLRSYSLYRFRPNWIKVFDDKAFGEAPFVRASVRWA